MVLIFPRKSEPPFGAVLVDSYQINRHILQIIDWNLDFNFRDYWLRPALTSPAADHIRMSLP